MSAVELSLRVVTVTCFAGAAGFALATGWWLLGVASLAGALLNGVLVAGALLAEREERAPWL